MDHISKRSAQSVNSEECCEDNEFDGWYVGALHWQRTCLASLVATGDRGYVCVPRHETAVVNWAGETWKGDHYLPGIDLVCRSTGIFR